MGLDICLRSEFTEEMIRTVSDRVRKSYPPRWEAESQKNATEYVNAIYAGYAETGAYFRDPYNRFGLLPILDIDIYPLISDDCTLPIEAARFLLAEVESRELTPASIEVAIIGAPPNGLIEHMEKFNGGPPDPAIDNIDWPAITAWLTKKRETLIALLRRSIELNEPLHCSG
jgi:hypothetical protein